MLHREDTLYLGILFLEKNPTAIESNGPRLWDRTHLGLNPGSISYDLDNFAGYATAQVDKYKPQHCVSYAEFESQLHHSHYANLVKSLNLSEPGYPHL